MTDLAVYLAFFLLGVLIGIAAGNYTISRLSADPPGIRSLSVTWEGVLGTFIPFNFTEINGKVLLTIDEEVTIYITDPDGNLDHEVESGMIHTFYNANNGEYDVTLTFDKEGSRILLKITEVGDTEPIYEIEYGEVPGVARIQDSIALFLSEKRG